MDDIKEWKVYMSVAGFLKDILWRYHREKRVVKGKVEQNFWDSIPMENLSPTQKKHLKEILKKEVRFLSSILSDIQTEGE